jgi:hypothetical protein
VAERKQISMWISAESAALLQRLADEQSQPKNRIIEWALAAYATSEPTSNDTSDLLELSNRVLALESRLGALEAERAVSVGAVGKVTVGTACEPVDAVLETVDAEPGIDQGEVQKAETPTGKPADTVIIQDTEKFKAAVVAAYKSGLKKGADILRHVTDRGYRNSNGKPYYRSGVADALKEAIRDGLIKG